MKKILLGVALSALTATPVLAADNGGYVTGVLGASNEQNLNTAISYGVLVGYKFKTAISAEAGYLSLANNASLSSPPLGGGAATASISGYELAGVYDYPLSSQISIFGRAGYAKMNVVINANGGSTSAAESGFLLGAGMKFKLSKSFDVKAGVNSYNLSNNTGSDTPDNYYLAGTYSF